MNTANKITLPSFDELVAIAESNPAGLDAIRASVFQQVVASVKPETRRRLEGLQSRIDLELSRSANPIAGCVKLSSMMSESVSELSEVLENPIKYTEERLQHKAEVIPLFTQ